MGVLRMSEYEDFKGMIHIQFDDLVGTGCNWFAPARVLKMSIPDFIMMLKTEYEANLTVYKNEDGSVKFIAYCWTSLTMARKFKNRINKIAREGKITYKKIGG